MHKSTAQHSPFRFPSRGSSSCRRTTGDTGDTGDAAGAGTGALLALEFGLGGIAMPGATAALLAWETRRAAVKKHDGHRPGTGNPR